MFSSSDMMCDMNHINNKNIHCQGLENKLDMKDKQFYMNIKKNKLYIVP